MPTDIKKSLIEFDLVQEFTTLTNSISQSSWKKPKFVKAYTSIISD